MGWLPDRGKFKRRWMKSWSQTWPPPVSAAQLHPPTSPQLPHIPFSKWIGGGGSRARLQSWFYLLPASVQSSWNLTLTSEMGEKNTLLGWLKDHRGYSMASDQNCTRHTEVPQC